MKKIILRVAILLIPFSSCKKDNCKDRQIEDMNNLEIQLQKDLSNTNLTDEQIMAIKARYDEKEKVIEQECN